MFVRRTDQTVKLKPLKTLILSSALFAMSFAFIVPTDTVQAEALPELTQLIQKNRDAVVNLRVESQSLKQMSHLLPNLPEGLVLPDSLRQFFQQMPERQQRQHSRTSVGSGFIIDSAGYIITNAHVVEDADNITVTLNDKRELQAEVIGIDKHSDLALLKIEAEKLPHVQLGNSDTLKVGQWVVAIGAPFGFDHTATQGIVSALSRSLPDGTYVPFIQTDVAVNPGNSGGPLFDLNGNVIGVNSQIYSRNGGYMGVSFAIPVNLVKNVAEQLKANGQVKRGRLGVLIQDMNQKLADSFQLETPEGALVANVEAGSPAANAGMQAGDIIIAYGDHAITTSADLPPLVGNTAVGKAMPITLLRNGKKQIIRVTIAQLEDDTQPVQQTSASKGGLGLHVSALTAEKREALGIKEKGVLIRNVDRNSPAQKAGLRSGDVILSLNHQEIDNPNHLKEIFSHATHEKPLAMLIQRGDHTQFIAISKPKEVS